MKRVAIIALLLVLNGCVKLNERSDVKAGISSAEPVIDSIEKHYSENGVYPESIEELKLPKEIVSDLKVHGIRYNTWNKRSEFSIAFGVSGLITNPWCGYGSTTNEWQCLYK